MVRLAEEYPDRAAAWFAVGCYYLCAGQYESARRFFGKATALDASFAPAWLGFGHAFAAQDESDQACRRIQRMVFLTLDMTWIFRLGLLVKLG